MSETASYNWLSCAIEARSAAKVARAGNRPPFRSGRAAAAVADNRPPTRREDALPVGLPDDPEAPARRRDKDWRRRPLKNTDQRIIERDARARCDPRHYGTHSAKEVSLRLGDIVFVELPKVGDTLEAGKIVRLVESVKAVSVPLFAGLGTVRGETIERSWPAAPGDDSTQMRTGPGC